MMTNTPSARAALARGEHDIMTRTRAFAALALGLIGRRADAVDPKATAALMAMVTDPEDAKQRDLVVAPVLALGLMKARNSVPLLMVFAGDPANDHQARAYSMSALAMIDGPGAKDQLLRALWRDQSAAVRQSAAMGLGFLVSEYDERSCDRIGKAARIDKDLASKNLATISLGQIGGPTNREILGGWIPEGSVYAKTYAPWRWRSTAPASGRRPSWRRPRSARACTRPSMAPRIPR